MRLQSSIIQISSSISSIILIVILFFTLIPTKLFLLIFLIIQTLTVLTQRRCRPLVVICSRRRRLLYRHDWRNDIQCTPNKTRNKITTLIHQLLPLFGLQIPHQLPLHFNPFHITTIEIPLPEFFIRDAGRYQLTEHFFDLGFAVQYLSNDLRHFIAIEGGNELQFVLHVLIQGCDVRTFQCAPMAGLVCRTLNHASHFIAGVLCIAEYGRACQIRI
mmetsp:Transcript_20486/g.30536  ORF Transcript_20486/g.30536 Transcript_20486/m.30536 type:complete len:217 (-) Transcript_20486:303-953(-)